MKLKYIDELNKKQRKMKDWEKDCKKQIGSGFINSIKKSKIWVSFHYL